MPMGELYKQTKMRLNTVKRYLMLLMDHPLGFGVKKTVLAAKQDPLPKQVSMKLEPTLDIHLPIFIQLTFLVKMISEEVPIIGIAARKLNNDDIAVRVNLDLPYGVIFFYEYTSMHSTIVESV